MKLKLLLSLILIETSFFPAFASIAKAQNFNLTTKRLSEFKTTEGSPLSREETIPQPIATDSYPSSSKQSVRPQVPTWQEFVEQGGGRYIRTDYDLPNEFRNGYVYFYSIGLYSIGAFILKQGLTSYPEQREALTQKLEQQYVNSGQAIHFSWNLSISGLRFSQNNPGIRFMGQGQGCLGSTCLTAPFMSNAEISRILLSVTAMEESTYGQ